MQWPPHITVASVIEREGRFLVVEEAPYGEKVLSFPAGHLEPSETLKEAAIRETLEETCWHAEITGFLNVSKSRSSATGITYLHISFAGKALREDLSLTTDKGILAVHWLTYEELIQEQPRFRSKTIAHNLQQYQKGEIYPLSLVVDDDS